MRVMESQSFFSQGLHFLISVFPSPLSKAKVLFQASGTSEMDNQSTLLIGPRGCMSSLSSYLLDGIHCEHKPCSASHWVRWSPDWRNHYCLLTTGQSKNLQALHSRFSAWDPNLLFWDQLVSPPCLDPLFQSAKTNESEHGPHPAFFFSMTYKKRT